MKGDYETSPSSFVERVRARERDTIPERIRVRRQIEIVDF